MNKQISAELEHLQNLKSVALITMPRAGSEYLQSLLDGHPEILVFILNFQFFSLYLAGSDCAKNDITKINPSDFIYEFVGKEISRFKGRYHKNERLDRLGVNGDQALDIDISNFKNLFLAILGDTEISIKNIFLSLYGAYHISVGRDLFKTKVIFHHAHLYDEAQLFKQHFSDAKLICCIRDPRASIKSMVFNCKDNYYEQHHYYCYFDALKVIDKVIDLSNFKNNTVDLWPCLYVRLEDLPRQDALQEVVDFIGVNTLPLLYTSTWAGLEWRGDRVSGKMFNPSEKWHINRSYNYWREKLSYIDKVILECIYLNFLIKHDYLDEKKDGKYLRFKKLISFLFFIKPLTLEYDFFSITYVANKIKSNRIHDFLHVVSTPYFYLRVRVMFFRSLLKNKR